jgi:hypothetical protein
MKKLIAIVAMIVLAASWAGGAEAKQPPKGKWASGYTIGYTETQTDLSGNVTASHSADGLPTGTELQGGADVVGAAMPAANALITPDAGNLTPFACCSSSGCDTVTPYVTKKDLLGIKVVWRFGHTVHWCWGYPHITSLSVYGHFWDVDGSSAVINYSNNGYGYYYTWAGASNGGHFSDRQGSISNCILHYGCLSTSYPEIQVWINGNGAWTSKVVSGG